MYLVKTPALIKTIFSDHIWDIPTQEQHIYLTFDDGPIPQVTPWVLNLLDEYNFKSTFFCVGENVFKYPDIYKNITDRGNAVGNHTYNHINGWLTTQDNYLENVRKADELISSNLFRPPYGKMRPSQASMIKTDKKIVMWDVLSGDFDNNISADECVENVLSNYEAGSIVVFHDNIKSFSKLKIVLPVLFDHMVENGFTSKVISW